MRQLILVLTSLLLLQCGEQASTSTIDETLTQEEIVLSNAIDFNEYLSIRVNALHEMLEQLQQADDADEGAQQLIDLSKASVSLATQMLNELNELSAFGIKGEELLALTRAYVESKITIMSIYAEFAPQLAIPESEWTNEDFDAWMSNAEPVFGISDQIFQELMDMQQIYLSAN
jgi:hypothetical protein